MTLESLEHLQRQLHGIDELRSIVRTMKALSAASIRQYEQAVAALASYSDTVDRGLQVVMRELPPAAVNRNSAGRSPPFAAIVFGSDHGLCGRFNESIAEHVLQRLTAEPGAHPLLVVGARVASSLEHAGQAVEAVLVVPGASTQMTATVQALLLRIDAWREQGRVDEVRLFYTRHSDGVGAAPREVLLLPVDLRRFQAVPASSWPSRSLPTFTMDRRVLLRRLVHQRLFVTLFRACAESLASEHANRLAAMQSAERNLEERHDDVTKLYRRARQSAITAELMDVIAGFEAIGDAGSRVS